MKDTCAVIVTFNRIEQLKECLFSLYKQNYPCDILVINNNSSDGTEEYLKENKIDHYTLERNIGGAGGFNFGVKAAYEKGYKFIWLMDDDCIVKEDSLEKMIKRSYELPFRFGFISSRVLWKDGNDHMMNKINRKVKVSEHLYSIKQSTFVSLLLSSDTVRKVGLPIKDFFIWGDDIEYTRRIAVRYALASYYVDDSIVIHNTKNNNGSKIASDLIDRIDRYYYAYRNENFLYRQEGLKGMLYYYLKCLYNLARIVFLSKNKKIVRIKTLIKGVIDGQDFNPSIEFI